MRDGKRPEIVVITGATAGIGRATARRFAAEGARVALLARGIEGLEATAREVALLGGCAMAIPTDVAEPDQVFAAADRIERELGPIDVWINNAAATVYGRVEQLATRELRRVTDVAYHGTVWGTQAALRVMRARNRGTIVQVGSAMARRAPPLHAAEAAAKAAVRAFTEALRAELLHDGVDVRLVSIDLPAINTPQHRWTENKMAIEPQPPAPIFAPEVAAERIHAEVRRARGDGRVERFRARRRFDRHAAGAPRRGEQRPSNLFAPVPGDQGAHGDFVFQAHERDLAPGIVAGVVAGLMLGAAGLLVRRLV